ncbi:hypothetical protein IM660_17435 [Ruania alkalisoli]|uniref:DZANK-type domain-containing protein n=1 Tax=Ruania alkalisoli TaxID=2779775 RepID=A0A7M1SS18_9MICO|nr:hypothetical protein [Ruania alkalisoli]QOR70356.1 hypothetical protein IM660_17435 [Ruania alkalisoli]
MTATGTSREITCPECGTITVVGGGRAASDFCPSCDYPLFWAQPSRAARPAEAETDGALNRAPGASGTTVASVIACPECAERNLASASTCVRCGSELHPAPPPEPEPPPAPAPVIVNPPAQIVQCDHWPIWLVLLITSVVTTVVTAGVVIAVFMIWG